MTLEFFREMLEQQTRVSAFRSAILDEVTADDLVLEIGAGMGTYSFFAAEAGAASVYAIESDSVVAVAKSTGRLNGYAERVKFLRGWFPDVTPPQKPTIVIFEDYPPRLIDRATHQMLCEIGPIAADGARLLPARARLCAVPVSHPSLAWLVSTFGESDDKRYGLDWQAMGEYLLNTPVRRNIPADAMLAEPKVLREVKVGLGENAWELSGSATWEIEKDVLLHGFAYYFEILVGNKWLTNQPGGDPCAWGHLFLPTAPFQAPAGPVTLDVGPQMFKDGAPGWLKWEVVVDSEVRHTGHEFKAVPAQLSDFKEVVGDTVPALSERKRLTLDVMSQIDGSRTVEDIVRSVKPRWPGFSSKRIEDEIRRVLSE